MLIDNDARGIQRIGSFLQGCGYEVLPALTVSHAEKLLAAKSPDYIILNNSVADATGFYMHYAEAGLSTPLLIAGGSAAVIGPETEALVQSVDFIPIPIVEEELLFRMKQQFDLFRLNTYRALVNDLIDTRLKPVMPSLNETALASAMPDAIRQDLADTLGDLIVYREGWLTDEETTSSGTRLHILVVDDSRLNQTYTSAVLKAAGYDVSLATNAEQALHFFKQQHPHLIVLDMVLPDQPGPVIARRIRQINPQLPIIGLSGFPGSQIMEEYPDVTFEDYFLKPVDAQLLLDSIRKLIGGTATAERNRVPEPPPSLDYTEEDMKAWQTEFKYLVDKLEKDIRAAKPDRRTLHGLLNYLIYFRYNEFREAIRGLLVEPDDRSLQQRCLREIKKIQVQVLA